MADTYTIKVKPEISKSDGAKMENDLNRRFNSVSKKFGQNLRSYGKTAAIAIGASLVGAAGALIGSILTNPFNEVNKDLDDTLSKFDNTMTRAEQFGVSAGKYFQAEKILGTAGVKDPELVLNRFMVELQKSKTGESDLLKGFVGEKDAIDAFYQFAESMRQLPAEERAAAVSKVIGDRQGLRLAELFQTDIKKRADELFSGKSVEELNKQIKRLADIEEAQAIARAKLDISELQMKSGAITRGSVAAQSEVERARLTRQVQDLGMYGTFAKMEASSIAAGNTLNEIKGALLGSISQDVGSVAKGVSEAINWFKTKTPTTPKLW